MLITQKTIFNSYYYAFTLNNKLNELCKKTKNLFDRCIPPLNIRNIRLTNNSLTALTTLLLLCTETPVDRTAEKTALIYKIHTLYPDRLNDAINILGPDAKKCVIQKYKCSFQARSSRSADSTSCNKPFLDCIKKPFRDTSSLLPLPSNYDNLDECQEAEENYKVVYAAYQTIQKLATE